MGANGPRVPRAAHATHFCINALTLGTRFPRFFGWAFGRRPWDYSMPVVTGEKALWNNADLADYRVDRVWDWDGESVLNG